jgi:hypothetical protein
MFLTTNKRHRQKRTSWIILACATLGAAWVLAVLNGYGFTVCPFRLETTLPCPGCGTTRAMVSLYRRQFYLALIINPMAYVWSLLITMALPAAIHDLIFRHSLIAFVKLRAWHFYNRNRWILLAVFTGIALIWANNLFHHFTHQYGF